MLAIKNDRESLRSLSTIFTPTNFKRIVVKHDYASTNKKLNKHIQHAGGESLNSLLRFLYAELQKNYRSEYVYKNALFNKLLLGKYSLNTTTIINEFKVGSSIADFTLLNGEARIFEIKTELDSLDKIEKQVNDYSKFANRVYVVTSSKYLAKVSAILEKTTAGIIEYTSQDTLREVEEAKSNQHTFDHTTIFKTLRKNEYLEVICDFFGYVPDVPNTKIFRACLELSKRIDVVEFQKMAFKKLKQRKIKQPNLLRSDKTPYELKHICYSLDLDQYEYSELYKYLNQPL